MNGIIDMLAIGVPAMVFAGSIVDAVCTDSRHRLWSISKPEEGHIAFGSGHHAAVVRPATVVPSRVGSLLRSPYSRRRSSSWELTPNLRKIEHR
jgi:hypothetical protein